MTFFNYFFSPVSVSAAIHENTMTQNNCVLSLIQATSLISLQSQTCSP